MAVTGKSTLPGGLQRQRLRLETGYKAARQLGVAQVWNLALYRLGLLSGYFRWRTSQPAQVGAPVVALEPPPGLDLPAADLVAAALGEAEKAALAAEAAEIAGGRVRLFGAIDLPMLLEPPGPLQHWTAYEGVKSPAKDTDIKFIWEPARLGWIFTLGRIYHLERDERYANAAWQAVERFLEANPPYQGPNWSSAQEAALRLLALVFMAQAFVESPHSTPERRSRLAQAIAQHAARIPSTLAYARAQNNNHLLSEAAGLFTAGVVLPAHPQARRWLELGWRLFHEGLLDQIAEDGTYTQHSANYHRLALQEALWMLRLADACEWEFPPASLQRLAAATRWLLRLVDPASGGAPNLGPNDGAYILPLTGCPFADYRPALQAAGLAFLGRRLFRPGAWDEMPLWLVSPRRLAAVAPFALDARSETASAPWYSAPPGPPHVMRSAGGEAWAYLRAARFKGRPGHADQLHLDLWWRGLNVAQDAGTYSYNLPPPWDNALACTAVHNTLTVNGRDQMQRAGRFLYLDPAQATVLSRQVISAEETGAGVPWERLTAEHDGYRRLGALHRRIVTVQDGGEWMVEDILMADQQAAARPASGPLVACLHWLLPDWPWQLEVVEAGARYILRLESPLGPVKLRLTAWQPAEMNLVRSGESLYSEARPAPAWGWSSPTYGVKLPALSARLVSSGPLPLQFTSVWAFPDP